MLAEEVLLRIVEVEDELGDEETAEMEGDEEVLLDLENLLLLGSIRGFPLGHNRP